MRVRRVILAVAAGVIMTLGELGTAGAMGCFTNDPAGRNDELWIAVGEDTGADMPRLARRSDGTLYVRYRVCGPDS